MLTETLTNDETEKLGSDIIEKVVSDLQSKLGTTVRPYSGYFGSYYEIMGDFEIRFHEDTLSAKRWRKYRNILRFLGLDDGPRPDQCGPMLARFTREKPLQIQCWASTKKIQSIISDTLSSFRTKGVRISFTT